MHDVWTFAAEPTVEANPPARIGKAFPHAQACELDLVGC
jgi:hypothetical protein